jgi:hypothetical protein
VAHSRVTVISRQLGLQQVIPMTWLDVLAMVTGSLISLVAIIAANLFSRSAKRSPRRKPVVKVEMDHEEVEAAHEKKNRLRENLLHACGGREDTLIQMLDMASGATSSRQIGDITGKSHTTIWRRYASILKAMSGRITPTGFLVDHLENPGPSKK